MKILSIKLIKLRGLNIDLSFHTPNYPYLVHPISVIAGRSGSGKTTIITALSEVISFFRTMNYMSPFVREIMDSGGYCEIHAVDDDDNTIGFFIGDENAVMQGSRNSEDYLKYWYTDTSHSYTRFLRPYSVFYVDQTIMYRGSIYSVQSVDGLWPTLYRDIHDNFIPCTHSDRALIGLFSCICDYVEQNRDMIIMIDMIENNLSSAYLRLAFAGLRHLAMIRGMQFIVTTHSLEVINLVRKNHAFFL